MKTKNPSEESLKEIARLLSEKFKREAREAKYASVKEVLSLLAKGSILIGGFIAPNIWKLAKNWDKKDFDEWKKFNPAYLRRTIRRLEKQKLVRIVQKENKINVEITKNGKKKVLKYALNELELKKPNVWDGKWRVIIYDIPKKSKHLQNLIRETLQRLEFIPLQNSVYLSPFPCEKEIEFLREFYGLGKEIKLLLVEKLENEKAYRKYFAV